MPVIPFHTKVSSCQSSFAVKSTGLIIEHFDRSNALFCVSFNQLKVVEVNEASVHFFSPCQFELISSLFIPRCGSVIVDLALKFSSTVRESEVLSILQDAVKNGEFGDFNVIAITGTRCDSGIASTPTSSSDSMLPQHIIHLHFCPLFSCFSEALANYGESAWRRFYVIVNIILLFGQQVREKEFFTMEIR